MPGSMWFNKKKKEEEVFPPDWPESSAKSWQHSQKGTENPAEPSSVHF
jgi:hypothetical protein